MYPESVSSVSTKSTKSSHSMSKFLPAHSLKDKLGRSSDSNPGKSQSAGNTPSRLDRFKASLKPPTRRSDIPTEYLYSLQ
ncbi:hypothetical protein VKT23_018107 [Stygiomarasmius scandens]|uniref:Uncharacterized protein n=1 Tax=Marasmiellus scandens TaxID=2682957 RepID=A0ABR1ISX9_9AGAR